MAGSAALVCLVMLSAAPWTPAPALPPSQVRGLDAPRASLRRAMGPSPTSPGGLRFRECRVLRRFSVLWTSDPGLIGTPDLEVRQLREAASVDEACADRFTGRRTVQLAFSDSEPVGASGPFLVLVHPDGHGVLTSLQIIDTRTGQTTREGAFNWPKGIDFSREAGKLGATYWRALVRLPCVPAPGSEACWEAIKASEGAMPLQHVAAPDCSKAVEAWHEKEAPPPESFQITVKVRDALERGSLTVLPGQPTCDLAP